VVAIFVIIGLVLYYFFRSSEPQYKVQMPNGDIKQMSESELVDYNKRAIKRWNDDVQKLHDDVNQSTKELKDSLSKIFSPTPSPYQW